MMRTRWIVVFAQGVVAAATIGSCGRDTIELARAVPLPSADGGSDASPPRVDGGACALECQALGGVCDVEAGACVECTDELHCAGKPPHRGSFALSRTRCKKDTRECVSCLDDEDCLVMSFLPLPEGERWVCDRGTSLCTRSCVRPDSCSIPFLQVSCDPIASQCLECATTSGCSVRRDLGNKPTCRNGRCVECQSHEECNGRRCHLASGRCEDCATDDDCVDGFGCHLITHRCVAAVPVQ